MNRTDRYDPFGGRLTLETAPEAGDLIRVAIRVDSPDGASTVLAHYLEAEDAVGAAHWLLRNAYELGDRRPEVATALGTLEALGRREEAQQQ
jgi:hypothetical protein